MSARLLAYTPDLLCIYRAFASVLVLITGITPAAPWLFATALVSDLFDGWFFRRYTMSSPYWHPWNPLPVSLDQLGDLTLTLCGTVYTMRFVLHSSHFIILLACLALALSAGFMNMIPELWPVRSPLLYTVCITILTHVACFMMIGSMVAVWYVNMPAPYWRLGAGTTIAIFYGIFLVIGDKRRLIRRPPAGWRA